MIVRIMESSSKMEAHLIILSLYTLAQVATPLLYRELRTMGVSCYPRDSCYYRYKTQTPDNPETDTCECDPSCFNRGTCCIDSPYTDPRLSTRKEVCDGERIVGVGRHYYFNGTGVYTYYQVTRCDRWWDGLEQVKEQCEMKEPVEGGDLMMAIPVTNTLSRVSYKNYFCALCNYDLNEATVLWDVSIFKDGYETQLSDRLNILNADPGESGTCNGKGALEIVYNKKEYFYGYWDECSNDTAKFVRIEVMLSIPKQIVPYVKGCRSFNLISQCAPGWRNTRVRLRCLAYMGMIKTPIGEYRSQYYRNVHCAQCNNVTNFDSFSCESISVGTAILTPTYPTSLTILFGHLLSDQGCLGKTERFVTGLGCRAMVCANPRHKVINGKCRRG